MSLFGLIGETVRLPFSAIADISKAAQGETPYAVSENISLAGEELEDLFFGE